MNLQKTTTPRTVMIQITDVELTQCQIEFNEWVKNQNLPTNDPFVLLNNELLNAAQRDKVWSFIYLLGESLN